MSQDTRAAAPAAGEQGMSQLVASVREDAVSLVQDHVELARAEMKESGARAGKGAGLIAGLALLALTAWFLLSFGLAFVLYEVGLPIWAGLMIVALVYLIIGGILGLVAKKQFDGVSGPSRAQESAQKTVEELKASFAAGREQE
jgi:uncharacterized membrane protein YqjE